MAELKAQGELDNTLVVLTADHGSVAGKHFYGKQVADARLRLLQLVLRRPRERPVTYNQPQDALLPLVNTGNVGLSYSDSMLRVWLKDQSPAKVDRGGRGHADDGRRHRRVAARRRPLRPGLPGALGPDEAPPASGTWFAGKAQELVDTEAADYGPDLIATLPDDTTYSVAGDHGGIQRAAQQIPIVFAGAGLSSAGPLRPRSARSTSCRRSSRRWGSRPTCPMDGVAYTLPTKQH